MANFYDKVIFCVGGDNVPLEGICMPSYDYRDGATSMYNIERDQWTEGPYLVNKNRGGHSCCTLGNWLYAVSGYPDSGFERVNA